MRPLVGLRAGQARQDPACCGEARRLSRAAAGDSDTGRDGRRASCSLLGRPRRPRRAGLPRNHHGGTGSGTISTPVEHLPRGHWRDGVRDWDARAPGPGPPPYFARRASGFGHTPFQVSTARAAAAEPLAELESALGAGADKSAVDEWLCKEELGHRD